MAGYKKKQSLRKGKGKKTQVNKSLGRNVKTSATEQGVNEWPLVVVADWMAGGP